MRKSRLNLVFAAVIIVAVAAALAPSVGRAEVNVSISIPLPPLVIPAPPPLLVVPGTYVYYPPDVGVDIFFYHGYWYRPYQGGWYMANGYNGPWRTVAPGRIPRPLIDVPRGYRGMAPIHDRVPYPTVRSNWRTWENERHWDNGRHGREERGEHHRGRGHGRGHDEGRGEGHGRGRD